MKSKAASLGADARQSTVLVGTSERRTAMLPAPGVAWRFVAWFGGVVSAVGLAQLGLYFYPVTGFGSPEWEFGVTAQILGALPLPTFGLAALGAAMLAQGRRGGLLVTATMLLLLAACVGIALMMLLSVAPMALRGTPAIASMALRQTIARSAVNGVFFGGLYAVSAVLIFRHVIRSRRKAH
jgi:hypothetical protein